MRGAMRLAFILGAALTVLAVASAIDAAAYLVAAVLGVLS